MTFKRKTLYFIISLFLLFNGYNVFSQNINVKCVFNENVTKTIRINKILDYITETQETVVQEDIDNSKTINLEFSAYETKEYILYVDFEYNYIWLKPGENYIIEINPKSNNSININPFQQDFLDITFSDDPSKINTQIKNFDANYDFFIINNFNFNPNHDIAINNKYQDSILNNIQNYNSEIVKNHIIYSFASVKILYDDKPSKEFIDKYFTNKPILYYHPTYISLFKTINKQTNYFINDVSTQNNELSELAKLELNYRRFFNNQYNKNTIINNIKKIASTSKSTQNKVIINNILSEFYNLKEGSIIPDAKIIVNNYETTLHQEINNLGSTKNKCLLFYNSSFDFSKNFINTLCENKNWEEKYTIIAIDLKLRNTDNLTKNFCKSNNIVFCKAKDVFDLHNRFNIRNYPYIIIIDKNNKIIKVDFPYDNFL
jgi:hypothetical protein